MNFRGKPQRNGATNLSARAERARLILPLTQFSAISNEPFLRKVGKTTKNGGFGQFFKIIRTILAFKTTFNLPGHPKMPYLFAKK